MALKLLSVLGTGNIFIAGMDGYTVNNGGNYFEQVLEYDFSDEIQARNAAIAKEINMLGEYLLNIKTKVNHRPLVIEEKRINFDE